MLAKAPYYESRFLRANHPDQAKALWLRETLLLPTVGRPVADVWVMVFDPDGAGNRALKVPHRIDDAAFDYDDWTARIGATYIDDRSAHGAVTDGDRSARWDLRIDPGTAATVKLLTERAYTARIPSAKSTVRHPLARFDGLVELDGARTEVDGWTGSVNHNWGTRHTPAYAFGQVCGFDNAPASFLEIATARVKLGPLWTPAMTPIVLRHRGEEFALNTIGQSLRAKAAYEYFRWQFASDNDRVRIDGEISARREDFVGLRYYNPPGGVKWCLNSKLADCKLTLTDKKTGSREELVARHRAAFEILTDDESHGVAIQA